MKILWIIKVSRKIYNVASTFIYTLDNFIDMDIVWDDSIDVDFINKYDVVFLYSLWLHGTLPWENVKAIKCLIAVDGQYTRPSRHFRKNMSYLSLENAAKYFDYAFVRSPLAWEELWPDTNFKNMFSFPPCINTDIIKDYRETKDIDISLIGSMNRNYPIRYEMLNTFKDRKNFVFVDKRRNPIRSGIEYSKFLNRSKISCSCSSRYKYLIAKCFEIPGSMSALLSDISPDMENLGFKDGVNMIEYDENVEEKVDYYLNNLDELKILTQNGYRLVREKHTAEIRVKEFLQNLKNLS